jgi:hypothetical protein
MSTHVISCAAVRPNDEFMNLLLDWMFAFRDRELPYAGCSDAFFRRALHNRGIARR